jgi:hypothetical protein
MNCCCNRKSTNNCEMIERSKKESREKNNNASCIYELVMTPYDTSYDTFSDIVQPLPITPTLSERRKSIYVNFFEVDEPNTPSTPELSTPRDVNDNTIHLKIPKGSNVYLNYERHYFDDF